MDRQTELELIDELLELKASGSAFLDPETSSNPVDHYASKERFAREREQILGRLPTAVAHVSEVAKPGDFVRRDLSGTAVLITRDKAGEVNAFVNVCRHRGTRLVDEAAGCSHRFSCPYHAWTYASSGELIAAPHYEEGFSEKDKAGLSLKRLACRTAFGLVWVSTAQFPESRSGDFLGDLGADLEGLAMDRMEIVAASSLTRRANWKILIEGGLESYHFRVAHRQTIGPYFEDNLSSYRAFGPHLRSILPRTTMAELADVTRDAWRLRDHANVIYTLFPTTQLLVQQDHVVWIRQEPLSADETRLQIVTLAPQDEASREAYWARNHQITSTTLDEDFAIAESIQNGLASGANDQMLFGRFEGALGVFNQTIEQHLA